MAHVHTHSPSLGNPVAKAANGLLDLLVRIAESNTRVKEVERLNQMSDAELAKRGLKREDIVRHVFRDVFYV